MTTVIKAQPGQPWPNPPHGGSWSRNPKTGDLTLVEATGELSVEQRSAAKAAAQAATEAERLAGVSDQAATGTGSTSKSTAPAAKE